MHPYDTPTLDLEDERRAALEEAKIALETYYRLTRAADEAYVKFEEAERTEALIRQELLSRPDSLHYAEEDQPS